jgi:hypothetical protein
MSEINGVNLSNAPIFGTDTAPPMVLAVFSPPIA